MALKLKDVFRKSSTIKLNFPALGMYYSVSKEDLTKRAEAGQLSEKIVNGFFDVTPDATETAKERKARLKAESEKS